MGKSSFSLRSPKSFFPSSLRAKRSNLYTKKVKTYGGYTYILTNKTNKVLYCGVTDNLIKRVYQHKNNLVHGFTATYNVHKLVWYEQYTRIEDAIFREKQLKGGSRKKKIELVNKMNPEWNDLYDDLL